MPRDPSQPPPPPASRYQAYLLRLWREGPDAPWRAALEPADGAAPVNFGTVGALFAFLRDQLADPDADGGPRRARAQTPPRPGGDRRRAGPHQTRVPVAREPRR